jgi:ABC-2 type transport system ATP-binding protein
MMLHVQDLTHQYGIQDVLKHLDLSVSAGQLVMLAGHNGSGKSTLLRCIASWTKPHEGTITINNLTIKQEREFRAQVILIPDAPDFYDELTAWEHLQFIGQLHKVADWEEQAKNLLEQLNLSAQKNAFPFTFSRGMRYKMALALAFLVSPPLLLLDEPFGPLDPETRQLLWDMLKAYRSDGRKSVLFSSHGMPTDEQPDAIYRLQDGQITVDAE